MLLSDSRRVVPRFVVFLGDPIAVARATMLLDSAAKFFCQLEKRLAGISFFQLGMDELQTA